jgi:hypothetical protein
LKVDVRVPYARVQVNGQWRHVTSTSGYASSNHGPLHFGLGTTSLANVLVHWANGTVTKLDAVKVDRTIRVSP